MSGSKSSQGGAFSNRRLRRRATPPVDEFLEVKAEWLNDGSLLDRVGMHCIEVFMREPDDSFTRWVGPGKLTVSSMCSGCEFPLLTSASLTRAMAMHHAEELLQLEVQDSCEIDPKKQRFIKRLHYLDMDPDDHAPLVGGPCLFPDTRLLNKRHTWCLFHKNNCSTANGDIIIIGFSCKDISRANPGHKEADLSQSSSSGGSCDTFQSLLLRIDSSDDPPCLLIVENVDALSDTDGNEKSNLDLVIAELSNRGYECKAVIADSSEFAVPQRRRRIYIVGIRLASRRFDFTRWGVEETFQTWSSVMSSLRMATCNIDEVLLPDSHPWVQASLRWAIDHVPREVEKTWLDLHMSFYKEKKLHWPVKAPSAERSCLWWTAVPHREQDIIATTHKIMRKNLPSLCDSSQNIFITPFSSKRTTANGMEVEVSPTAMPGARWWHLKRLRYVTGEEKLCVQGFPTRKPELKVLMDETDDQTAHKLGGDAFTGTVVLVVKWALIRACPWVAERKTPVVSDETMQRALAALSASSSSSSSSRQPGKRPRR